MKLPLTSPPKSICVLRLSAIGDICHTLPVVRTLQQHWPESHITWVIGKLEHGLVGDIPDIEFIVFNKALGVRAYWQLYQQLKQRRFDVLLHMQMSLRASLASLCIKAVLRLGFDQQRAKDMQWLFTNARIQHQPRQHVMDSLFGFSQALGIAQRQLVWDIPIPDYARAFARQQVQVDRPVLVIAPCSSMAYRNWSAEAYAEVANHALEKCSMQVILTGGPTAIERSYAKTISAHTHTPPVDLIGKTDLKQLLAVLEAATVVICPDAGTAHLANAVGTPVIGLYATTNPDRARPYSWPQYVINEYPQAVTDKYGKSIDELPWGIRVRDEGTMLRIKPMDVITMLERLLRETHLTKSESGD